MRSKKSPPPLKVPKEIEAEGITDETIQNIDFSTHGNKVQLNPNEEICTVLKSGEEYFVYDSSDQLVKENGKAIKISRLKALIGLARYIINNQEEINEKLIDKEVIRLKKQVDERLTRIKNQLHEPLVITKKISAVNFLEEYTCNISRQQPETLQAAQAIATEENLKIYKYITRQIELKANKNYDQLYTVFFQDGIPQIATFSLNEEQDMKALILNFHASKINQTAEKIKENSHLRNVATFNITKKP